MNIKNINQQNNSQTKHRINPAVKNLINQDAASLAENLGIPHYRTTNSMEDARHFFIMDMMKNGSIEIVISLFNTLESSIALSDIARQLILNENFFNILPLLSGHKLIEKLASCILKNEIEASKSQIKDSLDKIKCLLYYSKIEELPLIILDLEKYTQAQANSAKTPPTIDTLFDLLVSINNQDKKQIPRKQMPELKDFSQSRPCF